MQNYIDVSKIKEKEIYSLGKNFFGEGPQGTIGFTNYYLEENGVPFLELRGNVIMQEFMRDSGKIRY